MGMKADRVEKLKVYFQYFLCVAAGGFLGEGIHLKDGWIGLSIIFVGIWYVIRKKHLKED